MTMTKELTVEQKYACFKRTIWEVTKEVLTYPNRLIKHYFLEEFPIDVISFCCDKNLGLLFSEGMIDDNIMNKSRVLREMFRKIDQSENLKTLTAVKTSESWRHLIQLANEILALLYWD